MYCTCSISWLQKIEGFVSFFSEEAARAHKNWSPVEFGVSHLSPAIHNSLAFYYFIIFKFVFIAHAYHEQLSLFSDLFVYYFLIPNFPAIDVFIRV